MDYFYDAQVRRYVTQFMRIFIGFKYKTGGDVPEERHVPVLYGDMTRQVASMIKDNSENKLSTVPRIACYISGLELDNSRLSDYSFVSKLAVRERQYTTNTAGEREYGGVQGGGYTVERLMPTPFKLSMKAEIWTSNTDQKLQLLEQILVLFNPSLEIQTTDNYIDWTSISVVDLSSINFSSRTIPQGTESDIDICTLDFQTPIWISPPAKVKKMGIIKNIIMNVFGESGQLLGLEDLVFNGDSASATTQIQNTVDRFGVLLILNKATGFYDLTVLNVYEAVLALGLDETPYKGNQQRLDWYKILEIHGGYTGTSRIHFTQPSGYEVTGTFTVNEIDPTYLVIDLDMDTVPSNTISPVTAIVDPYKFSPVEKFGSIAAIPVGTRYLVLDDVNNSANVGQYVENAGWNNFDSGSTAYDGPDAWKDLIGNDTVIKANSIIQWTGTVWQETFDPGLVTTIQYFSNLTTGVQYKWDGTQWLRSFEGEYAAGYWRFDLDA
jgi:hypothetical protein